MSKFWSLSLLIFGLIPVNLGKTSWKHKVLLIYLHILVGNVWNGKLHVLAAVWKLCGFDFSFSSICCAKPAYFCTKLETLNFPGKVYKTLRNLWFIFLSRVYEFFWKPFDEFFESEYFCHHISKWISKCRIN